MKEKKITNGQRYKVYKASQVRQNGYVGFLNMAWAAGRFSLDRQHRSAPKIQLETVRFCIDLPDGVQTVRVLRENVLGMSIRFKRDGFS